MPLSAGRELGLKVAYTMDLYKFIILQELNEVDQDLGLVGSVVQCHHREPSFFSSLYLTLTGTYQKDF